MNLPDIITADERNFDLQVLEYSQHLPVVVHFWAKWCRDCPDTTQQLESLAAKHAGHFRLAQVNVDESPQLVQDYQVHTVPTLKTFENGAVTSQMEGTRTGLQIHDYLKTIIPGPEKLLLERAASLLVDGKYRAVEDTCLEALEIDPGNPTAKLLLAKSLMWQREYLEALTILHHFPTSKEYQNAEKLAPLAEELLTSASEGGSNQPGSAVYSRALALIRDGKIPAGLDGLLEIIKSDKKFRGGKPQAVVLGVFELLGVKDPLTEEYRQLLANALF